MSQTNNTASEELVDAHQLFMFLRRAVHDASIVTHDREFIYNIVYALQYIDHLLATLADARPTIHSQTCKSIILLGMGVVEAVLWYVVKSAGQANVAQWREVARQNGNALERFETTIRIETVLYVKASPPVAEEMTLDTLIKKVESKSLLGLEHKIYGALKSLRQLRNRIHIHDVGEKDDTDWYKFTGREVVMLLTALSEIFSTSLFAPESYHEDLLRFLDPSRVERRR
jgi:hypothetical protein